MKQGEQQRTQEQLIADLSVSQDPAGGIFIEFDVIGSPLPARCAMFLWLSKSSQR